MTLVTPRIRGRAGTADEGEHIGKWFYEITFWDIGGENQIGEPFQFGPFDSEEIACSFGKNKTKEICQLLEKTLTGRASDKYFDLKSGGLMRPWDEQ